jgi:creatinine amidohydrolase/Fe(II)-dependent formamide hydrolase-like protein
MMRRIQRRLMVVVAMGWCGMALGAPTAPSATGADSVYLEELTWTEVRDRVQGGTTTILVPIGGTEQNGPHMVLGKHNARVKALAGQIAQALGHALVAPVMAYVPEGSIEPPKAHMRFSGTITIPDAAFEAVLESAARSFRRHGFRDVVFLGDHGGYQASEQKVAAKLSREWAASAGQPVAKVHAPPEYYQASAGGFAGWLAGKGYPREEIGTHAGLADTSLALAVDTGLVRMDRLRGQNAGEADGVYGDPRRATAELGRAGLEQIVTRTVAALRGLLAAR